MGIFYDPKLSGEPNHRPALRFATVRNETYANLMQPVLQRHRMEGSTELTDGDLYFLMDGKKTGCHSELLRPFLGKDKTVREFVLHKDGVVGPVNSDTVEKPRGATNQREL